NIDIVSINAAPADFRRDDYAERVLEQIRAADIPASRVSVEVTETVLLDRDAERVQRALRALSRAGVLIELDDFGTGYASLSHLKQFPVNAIKIDRSFVASLTTDAGSAAIIKAVLQLGQSLGIRVTAEG